MAVNYYGSCTGTSSSKYNFWLGVTQNSQSVADNTSNVTVKVCLKRNDGYDGSAYNLNESSNSVKLSVGGTQRVSKNLEIDTRNCVTVTLASWTGNVSHNADGSLTLPVSASFTMGNSTLSGGSASGSFKCTQIPRASSLTLSSTTVNPGGSVTVTVTAASSGFKHKLVWSLGDESASLSLAAGVAGGKITVPVGWAQQVTSSKTGRISVSLVTYNGTQKVGTKSYTLSFVIPATDEYKPDFDIVLTRVDNGVPAEWEEYVEGVSGVTVNAENISYKYGAGYSSVTVTVGTVKKKSLPATFDLVTSGEVKISVSLKDTRGITAVKSTTVNVNSYNPPSVNINGLQRCNSEGVLENKGEYLLFDYSVGFSSINEKNSYSLTVKYRSSDASDYSDGVTVTENPAIIGEGNISYSSSYSVVITVADGITAQGVETVRSVPSSDIPFNIRRGGNGAAFGGYAENENELYVKWDMKVDGNVELAGSLNFENVSCEDTEYASVSAVEIRYYPALKIVFLRLRLKTSAALEADVTHYIAKIPDYAPVVFTPLSSLSSFATGGQSTSGIYAKTGDIVLRSDTAIAEGTMIYISGCYMVA